MTKHIPFPIDFDAYTTEEIEALVTFLSMIEAYHSGGREKPTVAELKDAHSTYRTILNNKSEEKRIDRAFERQTGISIYRTMKTVNDQ